MTGLKNYKLLTGPTEAPPNGIHFFQFLDALRMVHLYDDFTLMDPILNQVFPLTPTNDMDSTQVSPPVLRPDGFACNP